MTVRKIKESKQEKFDRIITFIAIIIMFVALIECVKTRVEISNFIESRNTKCLEDTYLE